MGVVTLPWLGFGPLRLPRTPYTSQHGPCCPTLTNSHPACPSKAAARRWVLVSSVFPFGLWLPSRHSTHTRNTLTRQPQPWVTLDTSPPSCPPASCRLWSRPCRPSSPWTALRSWASCSTTARSPPRRTSTAASSSPTSAWQRRWAPPPRRWRRCGPWAGWRTRPTPTSWWCQRGCTSP